MLNLYTLKKDFGKSTPEGEEILHVSVQRAYPFNIGTPSVECLL